MGLGLAVWWAAALVGAVSSAGRAWQPTRLEKAAQPRSPSQDTPIPGVPPRVTSEAPKEASRAMRSTKDKEDIDEQKVKEELIHSEELLEKYGYLDCVPPGSEANTHLHRLLLYRRRHLAGPGLDKFDIRTKPSSKRTSLKDLHSSHKSDDNKSLEKMSSRTKTEVVDDKQVLPSTLKKPKETLVHPETLQRGTVTVWDPFTGGLHHLPVCSRTQIEKAVKKFQEVYHVGNGGTLDSPTMGLLSRPRCGNPDSMMEEPEVEQGLQVSRSSRPRRRALQENSASQHDRDVRNVNITEIQTTSHETDMEQIHEMPDQEMLMQVAVELRKATETRHPKPDSHLEWEPHPQEALKRRKRWLEDLRARYTSGEEDVRLASLTPDPAVANTTAPQHHEHHRDKRSLFTYLGQRIKGKLIRWRLVTAGYSSQLDVGAQRASLALAFRMWSEVIPPVFLEQSAATAVDISIGFGKSKSRCVGIIVLQSYSYNIQMLV
ncbi:Matrix metalloproteinase-21 [Chionoecetes opilio]|uniref:Matrix metalloproteinase-21 n=1 Tax=Chionoecetes opilio TaxID=41210 RepID=A0A8J5D1R6_CHIOP|nr:Matrix metalloproteinase-21 [Chionoecetes opilio]